MTDTTLTTPAKPGAAGRSRPDRPVLKVAGKAYWGWTSVSVHRSVEHAVASFNLEVAENRSGGREPWTIAPGDPCQVLIDDDLVLTGYVDSWEPAIDSKTHKVKVSGRSKTCDLVDCSAIAGGGEFRGYDLGQIARTLCEPFGIAVRVEAAAGGPLPDVQIKPGDTVWRLLEKWARQRQVLLMDTPDGAVLFTRTGATKAADPLILGVNALKAELKWSVAERHSEYLVRGQRPGTAAGGAASPLVPIDAVPGTAAAGSPASATPADDESVIDGDIETDFGDGSDGDGSDGDGAGTTEDGGEVWGHAAAAVSARATDPGVTRYRPLVLTAEANVDPARAAARADWEARRRKARGTAATFTVQGWRQSDGRLWLPNQLVWCVADWLQLKDWLLIGSVEFTLSAVQGRQTKITAMPPDAYSPEPPETPHGGARRGGRRRGGGTMTGGTALVPIDRPVGGPS